MHRPALRTVVPVPYPPGNNPLLRYLLLASLLHGLALFWLQARTHLPVPPPPPTLQLELTSLPKPAESRLAPPVEPIRTTASVGTVPAPHPRQPPENIATAPRRLDQASPMTADALIESAHRQVREESRQRTAGPFAAAPPAASEPPPGPLAKAMARRPAGEKLLGGGILQITTAAGTVYCLQAPPKGNDGSLNEALAVPATCP